MTNWRDAILSNFVPQVSRLTLVADPDALLTEERLTVELRHRAFDLIEFGDSVEFRYAYESQYRSTWDQGRHTDLVVALRLPDSDFDALPYDLLRIGRRLAFDLGSLFPNLSYPVLRAVDRSLLDPLFEAQARLNPERMADHATTDFILRHVFGIAAELIATDVDLLRVLLRLHYRSTPLPPVLVARLVHVLESQRAFHDWPLEAIFTDDVAFYNFLQERWPTFLRTPKNKGFEEDSAEFGIAYPGPNCLPFGHHDIRIYVDNLFVEGKLTPVFLPNGAPDPQPWMRSGIIADAGETDICRVDRLFTTIDANFPDKDGRYTDWIAFAHRWAELSALVHTIDDHGTVDRLQTLGVKVNETFARWLDGHYAGLVNLPPNNPAMVHHISRRIARELERSKDLKVALVVVDGLALDQWTTVRHALQTHDRALLIREGAVFAWIPTITSISRQAIFAGKPPMFFPTSIYSTNTEGTLWQRFWEDAGFARTEIAYQRGLGGVPSGGTVTSVLDAALAPTTRIAGFVVDKIDRIMHGMQLGAAGMHNQIAQWCQGGFLGAFIGELLNRNYDVWLTSDHGNIECRGAGRPNEGVIAEMQGERVRIYPTLALCDQAAVTFAHGRKWDPVGLPPEIFPLVANGNRAFGAMGETIVGHGGVAIEEVVVPFVKFERRRA